MKNVNVDHIWRTVGPLGKYQWKQLIPQFISFMPWAMQGLTLVFIGNRPGFHCKPSENDTLMSNVSGIKKEYRQCEIVTYTNTSEGVLETSTPCQQGWDYDSPVDQSFITEWDFVCQHAELGELTQVLFQVGMVVGTFVFPTMSDRFGRKPVTVLSHFTSCVLALGTAFSGNYVIFLILRFFTGFSVQGLLAGFTLCLETLTTEDRHHVATLGLVSWTSSICLMSPIAYGLRNVPWKYLQMTYALCSALSIFHWWMIDESLRWVIANGQIDRAKAIIKNACKWNNKNYEEVMEKIGWGHLVDSDCKALVSTKSPKANNVENPVASKEDADLSCDQKNGIERNDTTNTDPLLQQTSDINSLNVGQTEGENDENEIIVKKYTLLDIFKYKRILVVSMIMWYIWICDSFVYYGIYMSSPSLYGDRYINFFLSAVVEYPTCLIQYLFLARFGRKLTAMNGHFIAAICLAVATALASTAGNNTRMLAASTAFTLIGKMGITSGYNTVYITTSELYPTNMRNAGAGVCSFMEKVGSMVAPFSRNVSSELKWVPQCIFAIMCLIAVLLFAFIPETNGVELPQTIEELGEWYHVNRFELKIGKNKRATKA